MTTEPAAAGGSITVEPPGSATLSVVHIITALGTGGAERQLQWLTAHSRHPSRTVALYAGGPVAATMEAAGHQVHVLGMAGRHRLTAPFRLAVQLRRLRPDVVHVHLLAAQLWGIPAARLAGVRSIVSSEHSLMDNTMENRPLTERLRRLYRFLEKLGSHTIAVSDMTRKRLLGWGIDANRITVVDNGIDFRSLAYQAAGRSALRTELGIGQDVTVIGGVGRLEPVKRFDALLRALAPTLVERNRQLVLAGDGPLRAELEALAAALGVADRVTLLGARGDMSAVLASFDVLVSPSRDETFGMAVVEALGNGLPVVYAQCPALDELSDRPPWAIAISDRTASDDEERQAVRDGVDLALSISGRGADHRFPVPGALTRAYGIDRTAAAVDTLYENLHRRRRAAG